MKSRCRRLLRDAVRQRLDAQGLPALVAELEKLNPAGLGALDVHNPAPGHAGAGALSRVGPDAAPRCSADFAAQPAPFADCTVRLCELVRAPDEMAARIARRVDAMLAGGLVAEVRGLLAPRAEGATRAWRARSAIAKPSTIWRAG